MPKRDVVTHGAMKRPKELTLPAADRLTGGMLDQVTAALGVERNVIALDDQIQEAWSRLPRLILRIPPELRDEKIVKACIAVASGLFDAAINYVWNAAVVELREKVRRFGLQVIPQILDDKSFDEARLLDLKDAELLELCLKLNLITDQDYFFLDQCRATRNSYSVAHPSNGSVDEDEVVNFISRCQKHALSSTQNPKGVDTKKLLSAINAHRFKKGQLEQWEDRLRATYEAQRELIFGMLHGVYCDPDAGEEARVNSRALCARFRDELTPATQSALVDRHQEYKARGDEKRHAASLLYFQKLDLVSLLGEPEIHTMVTSACKNLLRVHNDWNNFHNEPPFAERLAEVTRNIAVPDSAQGVYVEAVVTCGVGNVYGVSNAALPIYRAMVRSFSPKEIKIMLGLPDRHTTTAGTRIATSKKCARRFGELVQVLAKSSVPTSSRSEYKKWTSGDETND